MPIYTINIDTGTLEYFTIHENWNHSQYRGSKVHIYSHEQMQRIEEYLISSNDIRLVYKNLLPNVLGISFLHWNDGTDLLLLDDELSGDKELTTYFSNAVICDFAHVRCFRCGWSSYALVFYSDIYPASFRDLQFTKMAQRGRKNCPNCNEHLSLLVVKLFNK
jgi:hypothetical protein